jgi:hypothetical protein
MHHESRQAANVLEREERKFSESASESNSPGPQRERDGSGPSNIAARNKIISS